MWRFRHAASAAITVFVGASVLAACGGSEEINPSADLEMRLVIEEVPGYDCDVGANLAGPDAEATVCDAYGTAYLLGPAAITAADVQRALLRTDIGEQHELQLTFTAEGAQAQADLTAEAAAQEQGRIAIVSGGEVISAPIVMAPLVGDRAVIIAGNDQLAELAEELEG